MLKHQIVNLLISSLTIVSGQRFSELPIHNVVTRQVPGGNFICVPPGTCITSGGTPGSTIIDPRIVTPGGTGSPPTTSPGTCPAGQVPCYGIPGGAMCGTRYVTNINTQPGPATYGAYPWQAFMRNQSGFAGSGVLLDSYTVLTAAHKVYNNRNSPQNIEIFMGVWDPSALNVAQRRTVASMRIHPSFAPSTLRNDIAVLRLNAPVSLGYQINVGTACLPAAGASYVGRTCAVSGWGSTTFSFYNAPTNPQRQVFVPIVDYATCRTSMSQPNVLGNNVDTFLDTNELCAGGIANNDACTQDGGAPLVCTDGNRSFIAGLVIWGRGCGQAGVYGVYVDVARYRTWIDQAVNELTFG